MLQRQKGPEWWYRAKSIARSMFENPKSKIWIVFWVLLVATNLLFQSLGKDLNHPYTSEEKVLGIPLITTEPLRFAVISVGGIFFGIISFGGISLGLLSLGGLALGGVALGLYEVEGKQKERLWGMKSYQEPVYRKS
jgi:hypothetical protein